MSTVHLLVIDDNPHELMLIKKLLEKAPVFYAHCISDPRKALSIIRTTKIDIVIADRQMPQMDGLQLLRELRRIEPAITAVLLTGYADEQEIHQAFQEGVIQHYINKPIDPPAFRIFLKNICHQHNLLQDLGDMLPANGRFTNQTGDRNSTPNTNSLETLRENLMMLANHELRTPATIISAALDLINQNQDNLDPVQQKFIAHARRGAVRLNELLEKIHDLLVYERLTYCPDLKSVSPRQLLDKLIANLQQVLLFRRLKISLDGGADIVLKANCHKISQVLENIVNNAIKFTPNGGRIDISVKQDQQNVFIQVKDTGIGIPENELNNIFQGFYQLGNPEHHHSSKYDFLGGGAGLGLTLSRSIVEAHLGEIYAESDGRGKGTTIHIRLPLSPEISAELPGNSEEKIASANSMPAAMEKASGPKAPTVLLGSLSMGSHKYSRTR